MSIKFNLLEDCKQGMLQARDEAEELKLKHSSQTGFWPSMVSIGIESQYKNTTYQDVEGTCMRQAYYKMTSQAPTDTTDAMMQDVWDLGNAAEEIYKQRFQGLEGYRVLFPNLMGDKLRFQSPTRNIRGEVDLVLQHKQSSIRFGVEMKSYYGFWAAMDIAGYEAAARAYNPIPYIKVNDPRRTAKPFPKTQNLLQTMLYLEEFARDNMNLWKIIYVARDKGPSAEFTVMLDQHKNKTCVVVDDTIFPHFNLEGIHQRYSDLGAHVQAGKTPPRDFIPEYDTGFLLTNRLPLGLTHTETVKHMMWKDTIDSKRASAKTPKKSKEIVSDAITFGKADWQCRFCPYQTKCLSDGPSSTGLF